METALGDSGIPKTKIEAICKIVQTGVAKGVRIGQWLAEKVEGWSNMSPRDKAIILRESEEYAKKAQAIQSLYGGNY